MTDKPNITVTYRTKGVTRDGVIFDARVEGPAEQADQMKRRLEDMFYRADAKPLEEEEAKEERR